MSLDESEDRVRSGRLDELFSHIAGDERRERGEDAERDDEQNEAKPEQHRDQQ